MTNPKDTESASHESAQDKDSTKRAKGAPAFRRGEELALQSCFTKNLPLEQSIW